MVELSNEAHAAAKEAAAEVHMFLRDWISAAVVEKAEREAERGNGGRRVYVPSGDPA
jgi:hypothetical protein